MFQPADIKKPKPYSPHILKPEPKEWAVLDNIDWKKPLIIDVGCGKGDWIVNEAKKNPDRFYIGIERTTNKSQCFINKTDNQQLANLLALQADAIPLINQKIPQESVDEYYFFYPNPTPKKRQANQRFFVSSSFEVFDKTLKPGGKITLVSNIEEYVKEAELFLREIWGYQDIRTEKVSDSIEPRTAFEKKYLENKETLYELKVKK